MIFRLVPNSVTLDDLEQRPLLNIQGGPKMAQFFGTP